MEEPSFDRQVEIWGSVVVAVDAENDDDSDTVLLRLLVSLVVAEVRMSKTLLFVDES